MTSERIEPAALEEPARRFLEGLGFETKTSFVPLPGRDVYLVVKPSLDASRRDAPFTKADRDRRYALINKQLDQTISPEETVELAELEYRLDQHVRKVAPLPIEYALQVERDLLDKVLFKGTSADGPG